jgi:formylglycine-generating enzyme required for sulfatase activity
MRPARPALPHTVEVPAGPGLARFRLGRTPVTNAEYAAFVAAGVAPETPFGREPAFARPDQPVVGVTWFEAAACAAWLSERSGERWRLPSEAEWEHAARGGLEDAATPWGESLPAGEIPDGLLSGPWPVGRGTPNGYGLFDMGTIVHEWCLDWFDPETMTRRASRGGSWRHHVRWSRPSARSSLPPSFRYSDYGFRLLREAK